MFTLDAVSVGDGETGITIFNQTKTDQKGFIDMNATAEKSDTELKSDVLAELKYEPSVNITDIGVLVKDGAVTLNGFASSYGERWNAVGATKRVAGVRAIADDIVVRVPHSTGRTDGEIAAAAANQVGWLTSVPAGTVKITVRDGWIDLDGELEWGYQRSDAQESVRYLAGVKGVNNQIRIKPKIAAGDVKVAIERAFERSALLDAEKVQVETTGSKVTIRGTVRNYSERDEAERVAWAAPGVLSVDNKIDVKWSWDSDN